MIGYILVVFICILSHVLCIWFWWFSGNWDLSFEYFDWVFCVVFIYVYMYVYGFWVLTGWIFHVHKGIYVSGILGLDWVYWVVFFF